MSRIMKIGVKLQMLDEMRDTVGKEFDFQREAVLMRAISRRLEPDALRIRMPRPAMALCSPGLLVMEHMPGIILLHTKFPVYLHDSCLSVWKSEICAKAETRAMHQLIVLSKTNRALSADALMVQQTSCTAMPFTVVGISLLRNSLSDACLILCKCRAVCGLTVKYMGGAVMNELGEMQGCRFRKSSKAAIQCFGKKQRPSFLSWWSFMGA